MLRALKFELLLQLRTLRFRFGVPVCLAAAIAAPYAVYWLLQPHVPRTFGAGTYFKIMFDALRFPTVVLALIVAGNRADLEGARRMWPVLSSAPLGNAGYLLRKCLAQGLLVCALTLVPLLTTFGALWLAQVPFEDPWGPIGGWLLYVAPVAFGLVFLWGGLVRITGTELGSLMILVFGSDAVDAFFEKVVQPILGSRLSMSTDWLGLTNLQHLVFRVTRVFREPDSGSFFGDVLSTDQPFSWELAWGGWAPSALLFIGLCVPVFCAAVFFLRRTRKNLAPLVLSETHPLRNLLGHIHKLRQRYAMDAALHRERYLLLFGLGVLAASVAFLHHRHEAFTAMGEEKYRAQTQIEAHPPTPPGIRLRDWKVSGELTRRGLRVTAGGLLQHDAAEAVDRLSFGLNAFLEVEATLEGRRVEISRTWDRMLLAFEPALEPGDEARLEFRVSGRPMETHFDIYGWSNLDSFATRWEAKRDEAYVSLRNRLARSRREPLVSKSRVHLAAEDLAPVLRYGTWELTDKPVLQGERGYEVPEPTIYPLLDLQVDLRLPDGWIVGDSCGHASEAEGRLVGACTDAFSRYRVVGGLRRAASVEGRLVAAALPGHEGPMRRHFESVHEVVALSGEAWPGVRPIERLVVVEAPLREDPFQPALRGYYQQGSRYNIYGRLMALNEAAVLEEEPLRPESVVGQVMARDLMSRRDLEPAESEIFERIFSALMAQRMGVGSGRTGATISGTPWEERVAHYPVLGLEHYIPFVFERKVPAVWVYAESLVGADNIYLAIEDFLSRESEAPGTLAELIDDLERRGGVSLDAFYEHYLEGKSLPKLRLEKIESSPTPQGEWRLRGVLRNTGTGEVTCPVVAKAEGQEQKISVTVGDKGQGDKGRAPFELDFVRPPHTVQLDPDDTCYRWVTRGRMKVERISLAAGAS